MRKKIIAGVVLAALLGLGSLAFAETDYPSATSLRKILTRLDRITSTLSDLEAAVALIPTAS